jgi:hypothetical protein
MPAGEKSRFTRIDLTPRIGREIPPDVETSGGLLRRNTLHGEEAFA